MTSITRRMEAAARSAPVSPRSRSSMTPPMVRPRDAHAASSWAPSSKSSAALTPGAVAEVEPGTEMNVAKLTSGRERTWASTPSAGAPSVSKTE